MAGGARGWNTAGRDWNREKPESSTANSEEKSAIRSFRPPRRDVAEYPIPAESDFTGHVPDLARGLKSGSSVVTAGNEAEADDITSGVRDAQFRSDRDITDNPIELQGLQVAELEPTETDRSKFQQASNDVWGQPDDGIELTSAQSNKAPGPWQAELEQLIARAERDLASSSSGTDPVQRAEYRRRQVHLRMLYLIARHPERALMAIPSLDPADQEYWQQIVWAITNSLDSEDLTHQERAAQTIPPVNTALRRLREQAELTIRNPAFCEEISYFGNYKRFPREEFVPGQLVLLYAEIENFRSEPTQSGEYRTLLRSVVEIFGPNGQICWKKSFPATEDLCRNPRRDYFHNYQFTIPERLVLGPHTLKLTVVDELSGKQSTVSLNFVVK